MKVDTMRKIDFLAGVPLCFFTTLLVRFIQIFQNPRKKEPKNILLIELSEMGSTILVDPAMQKLKNKLNANLCDFQEKCTQLAIIKYRARRKYLHHPGRQPN
jgi:hypothetical protein